MVWYALVEDESSCLRIQLSHSYVKFILNKYPCFEKIIYLQTDETLGYRNRI